MREEICKMLNSILENSKLPMGGGSSDSEDGAGEEAWFK